MLYIGQALQKRRQDMELSLADLTRLLGGTPGESYLSRVERGLVPLSPEAARKIARVMRVPEDLLLNAAGHMTDQQVAQAVESLKQAVTTPADRSRVLPVLDETGETLETRRRIMSYDDEAFLIDFTSVADEPYTGEALVLVGRKPVNGIGVCVEIEGRLSAWTYVDEAGHTWIENGRKERRSKGYTVRGVIARVASERSFV